MLVRQCQKTYSMIDKLRCAIPNVALRTSLIVGFPDETEKEFEELFEFVKKIRFDRLGVFIYSHEENTSIYLHLNDSILNKIKKNRANRIMELQQNISTEVNKHKIGSKLKVLIDRKEGDFFIGRSEYDSPEIDNEVLIRPGKNKIAEGNFYIVKITSANEFDLYGTID